MCAGCALGERVRSALGLTDGEALGLHIATAVHACCSVAGAGAAGAGLVCAFLAVCFDLSFDFDFVDSVDGRMAGLELQAHRHSCVQGKCCEGLYCCLCSMTEHDCGSAALMRSGQCAVLEQKACHPTQ